MRTKGQVGDTVTWIVATILIVVIMVFFIFGSSMLASTKNIGKYKESLFSKESGEGDSVLMKKSIYTNLNLQSDSAKKKIDRDLENKSASGDFVIPYNQTKVLIRGRAGK